MHLLRSNTSSAKPTRQMYGYCDNIFNWATKTTEEWQILEERMKPFSRALFKNQIINYINVSCRECLGKLMVFCATNPRVNPQILYFLF